MNIQKENLLENSDNLCLTTQNEYRGKLFPLALKVNIQQHRKKLYLALQKRRKNRTGSIESRCHIYSWLTLGDT